MKHRKKLEELVWEMPEILRGIGLAVSTIGGYMKGYSWVLNFHEERGAQYFDRDIMTEYVRHIEKRRNSTCAICTIILLPPKLFKQDM
jgi:hypothetical protein